MPTVLITGGAGYLGSVLIEAFLKENYKVIALDRFDHGHNSLAHLCHFRSLTIVKADCRDKTILAEYLPKADFIIPLAAIVGAKAADLNKIGAESTNYQAVKDLAELKSSSQVLLYANTNSGYGHMNGEDVVDENSRLTPHSFYAKSKIWAENEVLSRENALSFRLATVFGASSKMRRDLLVNDFVYRACKDKSLTLFDADFRRNFIHIRDVAWAFVFAMTNFSSMKNDIYNVGLSSANLTKRELCHKIQEELPDFQFFEGNIGTDIDKRDYLVSNKKIESKGWEPRYQLQDGVRELIKLYQTISDNKYANV